MQTINWKWWLAALAATGVGFGGCSAAKPPKDAFPNSVAFVDGKGELTWWGCMALPSGDAREVGSYRQRALLFLPGERCNVRNPPLLDRPDTLYVTWRIGREGEPFGGLWLIVPGKCPESISGAARDGAMQLVREYLAEADAHDRYRDNALAALDQLKELLSTQPIDASKLEGEVNFPLFPSGTWGPMRQQGGLEVCGPVGA